MPLHVLVYDHNASVLAAFQYALLRQGYRVTARFPREIEPELVAKHAPDVILLALQQGAYHGSLERIQKVHDDPTLVHIPVIIAVPEGAVIPTPDDVEGFYRVSYAHEPFNIDEAVAIIRTLEADANA